MSIANIKDSGNQGNNMPWQWKMLQGLQAIADATSAPLTCVEDSVTICAGGNLLTSTTIGADTGLDVNIIGGVTLEVNLDAANDQVGVYGYVNGASGSPVPLNTNASGQVAIQDGGNSITVDALNLDIRDLSHLVDTVKIYGSNNANPVATDVAGNIGIQDGGNSITVDGGTGTQRTPTFLRPAGTDGTVAAGTFSMSFASVGTADATVGGITLKPGETINFDAGAINNTLGAVSYVTSSPAGAELIIITLT